MEALKQQYPSFGQERLWFIQKLNTESLAYNVGISISIEGELDLNALYEACEIINRRHESLRMNFQEIDGKPTIKISDSLEVSNILKAVTDLEKFRDFQEFSQKMFERSLSEKFNLETGPLVKHSLFQYDTNHYLLAVSFHHIIFDGWSSTIYVKELYGFYQALSSKKVEAQEPLKNPYLYFIKCQRERMQDAESERLLRYWKNELQGLCTLVLPSDKPRLQSTPEIVSYKFYFPDFFYDTLKHLTQEKETTIFNFLFVSFYILLSRYSGQKDFLVGVPFHGREYDDFSDVIGFFVNTLPIRITIDNKKSFGELLEKFKITMNNAFKHQDIQLEKLANELKVPRVLNRDPIFQVMFGFNNFSLGHLELENLKFSVMDIETGRMPCDLSVGVSNYLGSFNALFKYDSNIFEEETIKNISDHWFELINNVIKNFEDPIKKLDFLTKQETQRILVEWNNTVKHYDKDKTFKDLFERQVRKTPDNIAILSKNKKVTYEELNQRVNKLSHFLIEKGVRTNTFVAIACERSIDMIVAMLGVLKAGGVFVPLDPTYPTDRLRYALEDTQAFMLITQRHLLTKIPSKKPLLVFVDEDQTIESYESSNPISFVRPQDLAYVIYTSGSTGKPKGVMIQHASLYHFAIAQTNFVKISEKDRVLQFFSINFDASIAEWCLAFSHGASLCLIESKNQWVGSGLEEALRFYSINVAFLTPSVLNTISLDNVQSIHTLVLGGESCSKSLLLKLNKKIKIVHQYGPTEATVCSSFFYHDNQYPVGTIGRPIQNTKLYVLNENLKPVPPGVTGELYISGPGLAKGYLNNPELTEIQFIKNPFMKDDDNADALAKCYKTGDMCRYLKDGNIEYLRRSDEQVKIRGFRIELGEIENALRDQKEIKEAVVVIKDQNNEKYLIAYVFLNEHFYDHKDSEKCSKYLRGELSKKLPYYMLPNFFIFLDNVLLTNNGKFDRSHLPDIDFEKITEKKNSTSPRSNIEIRMMKIWSDVLKFDSNENNFCIFDNFFELGGNSLMASRLISKINNIFSCSLLLTDLFENATVEGLSKLIEAKKTQAHTVLIPIQQYGFLKPIFCIHAAGGNVLCYRSLLRFLDHNQPVYGLQSLGILPENQLQRSIEEMAITYVRAIREKQPIGPYKLLGWSTGGIIAFEIAHQLEQQNHKVEKLFLIDTRLLSHYPRMSSYEAVMKIFLNNENNHDSLNFSMDFINSSTFQTKSREEKIQVLHKALLNASVFSDDMRKEDALRLLTLTLVNVEASYLYKPKFKLEAPVQLFIANRDFNSKVDDEFLGWKPYAKQTIKRDIIDCDHYTILEKLNMDLLSQLIREDEHALP